MVHDSFLGWLMYGKVPTKKHETLNEFLWNLEV